MHEFWPKRVLRVLRQIAICGSLRGFAGELRVIAGYLRGELGKLEVGFAVKSNFVSTVHLRVCGFAG